MLEIRPDYYEHFTCIADRCDFTCCQEWKIAVDHATNARWKRMIPPREMKSKKKNLSLFTGFKDGGRVITLDRSHCCPFLTPDKLCRLVITYGEECLSETCHTFPREKHSFDSHREDTLMPCCPEVVDFLQQAEQFSLQYLEDGVVTDCESLYTHLSGQPEEEKRFRIRQLFIDILGNKNYGLEEELLAIFFMALSFLDHADLEVETAAGQLDEIIQTIRELPLDQTAHLIECKELFLDLIDNYRREGLYERFLNPMVLQAESDPEGECTGLALGQQNWLQQKETYENLFRKLLQQELYADLLMPEGDLESLVVKLEWIAMEYVQIRQMCRFHLQGQSEDSQLEYPTLRNYIVLVSRMMGYEEEDIYEYLENSFEDVIWEWGYMALIMGK